MAAKRTKKASPKLPTAEIGILGGTGLYAIDGITNVREVRIKTPLGDPSDAYYHRDPRRTEGRLPQPPRPRPPPSSFRGQLPGQRLRLQDAGRQAGDLGERGRLPQGGDPSLRPRLRRPVHRQDLPPEHVLRRRAGRPCRLRPAHLRRIVQAPLRHRRLARRPAHLGGTYVCMEGPAFSTKAESRLHRLWGGDVIGMTGATEAKLFREAEICYATMNLATDYDCWHESEEGVTVEIDHGEPPQEHRQRQAHHQESRGRPARRGRTPADAGTPCGGRS